MSFLKADQVLVRLALTASCALLAACQGMYIYNPDRAAVATTARKSIDAVDVASISKTEQENLAKLLEAEIKAIDDRSRLIATLAVLDLAASDQSTAKQYESALKKMAIAMHTQNMLALKNRSDCLIDQKAAVSDRRSLTGLLSAYGAKNIPACAAKMPGNLPHPPGLTPEQSQDFDTQYSHYVENCQTLLNACSAEAINELLAARETLADKQRQESALKKQIEKARDEYQTLVNANKDRAQAASSTEEAIRTKAKSLTELVNQLTAVSPTLANQIKGSAVVELLNAAATGKSSSTDPDLAPALEIAKAIPSLAESIDTAKAKRAMVPVSHLLLALNNLTIQAERDERLRALDVEEIGVIERKVEALDAQAQLWRRYSDQLCNLVVLRATKRYPGGSCDTIDFPNGIPEPLVQAKDAAEPPVPPKLACKVSFTPDSGTERVTMVVDDCVLGKSWRALFEESAGAAETRALNEAAAAYLNVRLVAYSGTIEEFRRIGLDHRRTVVRSEASLQQWKNLVSVPASELEGYYGGGIKPNELADLIVKALGFTAIAIGVAQ